MMEGIIRQRMVEEVQRERGEQIQTSGHGGAGRRWGVHLKTKSKPSHQGTLHAKGLAAWSDWSP